MTKDELAATAGVSWPVTRDVRKPRRKATSAELDIFGDDGA